jgi:hypothetical protein
MSKLMTRLEALSEFQKRGADIKAKAAEYQRQAQALDKEFGEWLETEFKAQGDLHLSDILKLALESSIEPSRIIKP